VFSGDPHPGNYLFCDDGKVCFIDFGFVERFEDPERDAALVRAPLAAALRGDADGIAAGLRGWGIVPKKGKSKPLQLWEEVRPLIFGPIEEDAVVRFDTAAVREGFKAATKMSSELNKMRKATDLQPWITMLMRYAGGTLAVIGKLSPEVNWHQIARELALDEEPTSVIGKRWDE
jgi:predicted unusual protein kinase regulating ubiquinone biosynthesis (AarF/ABC1/UbiB family)